MPDGATGGVSSPGPRTRVPSVSLTEGWKMTGVRGTVPATDPAGDDGFAGWVGRRGSINWSAGARDWGSPPQTGQVAPPEPPVGNADTLSQSWPLAQRNRTGIAAAP